MLIGFAIILTFQSVWASFAYAQEPPRPNSLHVKEKSSFNLFVAKNGKDSNPGTEEKPFLTIQKAADVAKPGDHILIKEGVYKEFVTIKKSGLPGNHIIFEGERGIGGEYKTIIDPGTVIKNWAPAPEIGRGVYRTRLGFEPREMTVDDRRIGRINTTLMKGRNGLEILATPPKGMVNLRDTDKIVKFWDGVEALYGTSGETTYIRFRNQDNPNTKTIKAAPRGYGILIPDQGYITIRNLWVRNCLTAIRIKGEAGQNNRIEENRLTNGACRVMIDAGAGDNVIEGNTLTMNYYASDHLGAGALEHSYQDLVKIHVYKIFKFTIGSGTSDDCGIRLINAGDDNQILDNHVFGGLVGISAYTRGTPRPTRGLRIRGNRIHNMSSVGITSSEGQIDAYISDNTIYDCNINIRLHDVNKKEDLGRRFYIHNNRLWNPPHRGYHLYVHGNATERPQSFPVYYIYGNHFYGGRELMGIMKAVQRSGCLPGTHMSYNVLSSERNINAELADCLKESRFGLFDHNWIGGVFPKNVPRNLFQRNNTLEEGRYRSLDGETSYFNTNDQPLD